MVQTMKEKNGANSERKNLQKLEFFWFGFVRMLFLAGEAVKTLYSCCLAFSCLALHVT